MFHTDDEFLAAVERSPAERTVRLVYADWLDEHNDPRAELIRVEEAMRELPVFADRFWALKPRRNELRSLAGADWCGRMRYGTEAEPVFRHGIPDGWRERWRLIREFTERWLRRPMPDVGGRQAEIAEAEARLGRTLPPAVREWVAFTYDAWWQLDPPGYFDAAYQTRGVPNQSAFSLMRDDDDAYHWAVPEADLGRSDPPVYGYRLDYEGEQDDVFVPDGRNPLAGTVTRCAFDFVALGNAGAGGGLTSGVREREPLIRELTAAFPVHVRWDEADVFEGENVWVWVRPWRHQPFEAHLVVKAFKAPLRKRIPKFLWDYTRPPGGTDDEPIPF